MSFGLTAAQVGLIGMGAGALAGGSSGSNSATTTQQNQLDPRMADFLYGGGGLLNGVRNLYQQQIGQGGLNPMQTAGLELQRRTLMNPAYTQGFDQMRNVGAGLMGGGVAGNPFGNTMGQPQQQMPADGRAMIPTAPGRANSLGFLGDAIRNTYQPTDPLAAAYQPIQQGQAPMQAPVSSPLVDDMIKKYNPSVDGSPYFGYKPGDPIGGIA
jgi:hypothetical protein